MKGFFYRSRYFLLPEDCLDTEELTEKYGGQTITVTELIENKCMAPHFIRKHAKKTEIALDERYVVYPCEVFMYTMKEYNARLREIIPPYCVGCPNFGGIDKTDASLDGHHEEISLERVCFNRAEAEREEETGWPYFHVDEWIDYFSWQFGTLGLEVMIDKGEHAMAAETFSVALSGAVNCPVPPVWFRKQENGKYEMICTTFNEDHDGLIVERIVKTLREQYEDTWDFYNYIPKGTVLEDMTCPLGVKFLPADSDEPSLELTVYAKEGYADETYLWLCGLLGECEFQKFAPIFNMEEIADESELPTDAVDAEELTDVFEELCMMIGEGELIAPAAHTVFLAPNVEAEELSEEEMEATGRFHSFRSPYLFDRVVASLHVHGVPGNIWENCGTITALSLPIARIRFTDVPYDITADVTEETIRFRESIDEFFYDLSDAGVFKLFAQTTGTGCAEQYGIVLNLTKLLYTLRYYAPVFGRYPAELEIYTETHKDGGRYKLGYDMTLLASEEELWTSDCDE
ncbi:MAG: hypothetical protein IJV98_06505 [Clostridia bacterium]|nr:hypothetical protein [Clostridia bacterium]